MNVEKLRKIWDEHAKPIYAYLLKLTKNEEDARDFLQDMFHRLARQPGLLDKLGEDPRGYLIRFAHNAVVDQTRRGQTRERIFEKISIARSGESTQAENPDNPLLRRAIAEAMQTLEKEQREVVYARLWKRKTLDEIAVETGLSINTVASRYRYGLDKIRSRLRSLYEDFAPRASSTITPNTPSMKKNQNKPVTSLNVEDPIIQPLEQRRVPSATGGSLMMVALPVPDDTADPGADHVDVSADPVAIDTTVTDTTPVDTIDLGNDGSVADDGSLVDGGTDLSGVELPITFDDMVLTMNATDAGTLDLSNSVDLTLASSDLGIDASGGGVVGPNVFFHPMYFGSLASDASGTDVNASTGTLVDSGTVDMPNVFFPLNSGGLADGSGTDGVDHSLDGAPTDITSTDGLTLTDTTSLGTDGIDHSLDGTTADGSTDGGIVVDHFGGIFHGGIISGDSGIVDKPNVFFPLNDGGLADGSGTDGIDHSLDGTTDGTTNVTGTDGIDHSLDGTTDGTDHSLDGTTDNTDHSSDGSGDGSTDGGIVVDHFGGILHGGPVSQDGSDGSAPFHPIMYNFRSLAGESAPADNLAATDLAATDHVTVMNFGGAMGGPLDASHDSGPAVESAAPSIAEHPAIDVHPTDLHADSAIHSDGAVHGHLETVSGQGIIHFAAPLDENVAPGSVGGQFAQDIHLDASEGVHTGGHIESHTDTHTDSHPTAIQAAGNQDIAHDASPVFAPADLHSSFDHAVDGHAALSMDAIPVHHDSHDFSVESHASDGMVSHWAPLHDHDITQDTSLDHSHQTATHDDFIPMGSHSDHQLPEAYVPSPASDADALPDAAHANIGGSPAAMAATGAALLGVESKKRDKEAQG